MDCSDIINEDSLTRLDGGPVRCLSLSLSLFLMVFADRGGSNLRREFKQQRSGEMDINGL